MHFRRRRDQCPVGAPALAASSAFNELATMARDSRRSAARRGAGGATRCFWRAYCLALVFIFVALPLFGQMISSANLPLYFQANHRQTQFLSSGNGCQFKLTASSVQMALRESRSRAATAEMRFLGASPVAQIRGGGELFGKVNYLIGNDRSKWQTGLPTFGSVRVAGLYPGINLLFHGNHRQLEYDFAVAPGADASTIKMRFDGVRKVSITPNGDLVLKIGGGEIRQPEPQIYQVINGARRVISGGYKILDSRTVGFAIAGYDHSVPLVIDPILGYSTFFGGSLGDTAWAIAMDSNENLYIAGQTVSKEFATFDAYQTNFGGGSAVGDAFVAKFFGSPPTNLVYLTYLGGSSDDAAYGLAVDGNGHAFVTGATESPNFPTNNVIPGHGQISGTKGPTGSYLSDAFVAELGAAGSNLIYSSYLGGNSADAAYGIALDSSDDAYVTGFSYSTNFPVSANALQTKLASTNGTTSLNANAFLSEIANGGGALDYSTYLGGTNYDVGRAVAVDANDNVYVAGYTASFNFPTWNTPGNLSGGHYLNGLTNKTSVLYRFDAFATKFPPLNSTIPPSSQTSFYSTFLGGTNNDMAYGIAADAAGDAYVTGWTASTNFPLINSPPGLSSFLTTNGNSGPVATNVFLTKIAPDGSTVLDSTVFGGNRVDIGYGVAVDAAGDAFVVGAETSYTNFPTKNAFGSLLATNSTTIGCHDAFVTGVSADWTNVFYSVCIGGNKDTYGYGIALDSSTNVFITGGTDSTNYPTFNANRFWFNGTNVINGTNNINGARFTGTNDAFLTEIAFAPAAINVSAVEPASLMIGMGATATFGVTVTGANGQVLYQWQKNGTNLVNGGRISGATGPALTITNAQAGDSNTNYGLVVSYPGTIISPDATNLLTLAQSNIELTVTMFPVITTALTNQTVYVGTNVTFSVAASGAPLTYSWSTNGSSAVTNGNQFSGATSNTLTVSDVNTNNSGFYYVLIQYPKGAYTNDYATLTVVEPLSIVTAPTNQTVPAGANVSFTVVATGFPLSYQWQFSGTNLINGDNISGATADTLTITNAQPSNAGTYTVSVNNALQTNDLSAILTVTLNPYSFTGVTRVTTGSGNELVLSGGGGTTNGAYYVLTSTNLMAPLAQWTPIATNQFDSQGQFSFTNPIATNAAQFFILKQP